MDGPPRSIHDLNGSIPQAHDFTIPSLLYDLAAAAPHRPFAPQSPTLFAVSTMS